MRNREVGWEGSPPYFIYMHHTPISRHRSFSFVLWSFGVFFACISIFVLGHCCCDHNIPSALQAPQRCCNNLYYRRCGTANSNFHRCFRITSRNQMNNPRSSMKLVWVLVRVTQFFCINRDCGAFMSCEFG